MLWDGHFTWLATADVSQAAQQVPSTLGRIAHEPAPGISKSAAHVSGAVRIYSPLLHK